MTRHPSHGGAPRGERISIVRTLDDFMRVAAIRSIVYIADQHCPYAEEFDGNDFCGMHLVGWSEAEPAACLRIRYFNGFAKIERLAVRQEFRQSTLAFRIVRFALQLVARKGYRTAYGHAQEGLEDFWARFGAGPAGPAGGFAFSGRRYTEMIVDLPPSPRAIGLGSDPLVIVRPEGEWDQPGVLERGSQMSPARGFGVTAGEDLSPASFGSIQARMRSDFMGIAIQQLLRNGLRDVPRERNRGAAA